MHEKESPDDIDTYLKCYMKARTCLNRNTHQSLQITANTGNNYKRLEVDFRITNSILKYVLRHAETMTDEEDKRLMQLIDSSTLLNFMKKKLNYQPTDNKTGSAIINACIQNFHFYLYYCSKHYKSSYCLAKMYLTESHYRDLEKCEKLLLSNYDIQMANESTTVAALFTLDNATPLFKVMI